MEYVTVIFKMYFVSLNGVGIFEVPSSCEGRSQEELTLFGY